MVVEDDQAAGGGLQLLDQSTVTGARWVYVQGCCGVHGVASLCGGRVKPIITLKVNKSSVRLKMVVFSHFLDVEMTSRIGLLLPTNRLTWNVKLATLYISNFLGLKKVNISLKRINVFIGPQAQGKSVISKLIYFFKELPSSIFDASMDGKDKRQFDALCKERFLSIFPLYVWESTPFLIFYDFGSYTVSIENSKINSSKCKFSFTYTDSISKALVAGRKAARGGVNFDVDMNVSSRVRAVSVTKCNTRGKVLHDYSLHPLDHRRARNANDHAYARRLAASHRPSSWAPTQHAESRGAAPVAAWAL